MLSLPAQAYPAQAHPAQRPSRPRAPDQAAGLRRMLAPRGMRVLPVLGPLGAESSAALVAALAGECAALGLRPLVMDQSRGTVAARFGLRARYELAHVLRGDRDWSRVALDCGAGITLLPAKRGLPALAHEGWTATLLDWIYALPQRIDLVILNLASPQAAQGLIDPRGDWLVAIPGRNPNLIGAYRALKHLCGMARPASVRVLLEGHPHRRAAAACFASLAAAARRFLALELEYCGCLPGLDGEGGAARQLAAALEGWRLRDHAPARACGAGPQRERIPRGS